MNVEFSKQIVLSNGELALVDFAATFKHDELWSLDVNGVSLTKDREILQSERVEIDTMIDQGVLDKDAENALELELAQIN